MIPFLQSHSGLTSRVSTIFANGEPGVWYDPSDLSTLFQDAAGTTPVTAVEQPVGLMLDKSKGLVLGPELVTNGTFDTDITGWSGDVSSTLTWVDGKLRTTRSISIGYNVARYTLTGLTVGRSYLVTAEFSNLTGNVAPYLGVVNISNGTNRLIFRATATTHRLESLSSAGSVGNSWDTDNISVREIPGNHAYQTTATSRPVLSARYNLLTKTEQFDDAVWSRYAATVTANATTAPNGTLTADTLTATGSGGSVYVFQPLAGTYTISVYAKAGTSSTIFLVWSLNGNGRQAMFTLSGPGTAGVVSTVGTGGVVSGGTSSIINVGNGWYRCVISDLVCGANSGGFIISVPTQNQTAYIWGASLVPANQASLPYQRVNTATDYDADPAKFPHYLRFDGVDDWLVTNTITPGIDKVQVFAGVRKMSSAASAIAELSNVHYANNGAFGVFCEGNPGAINNYAFDSKGTILQSAVASPFAAPIINVLTGLGNISGDSAILRVNGTQAASSTSDQGTGNYLAYPLYIGRRGGTTLPFNGHLYSLIVRFGPNLPAATIENTEKYINSKTKAY